MFHQLEKERQVVVRNALLIKCQDKGPARGMDNVVGIFDAFSNALEGQQLAQIVASDKGRKLLVVDFGVDSHKG